ncbi:MAG TPA: SRPBCC domain-containing protein [Luteimonas sp.]|nr:SRPBCC domain-containing protein [Luteimonas sp.]HRO27073.1 SRPBCC domain-containing protein [Luteimonas sp.]HRP71922.1 SRPBCC domain-containing protein [Luteimonas sp.]
MSPEPRARESTRDIRHTVHVGAPPSDVAQALLRQEHLRRWWTREADVVDGNAVLRWSGHGFEVHLRMEQDAARNRVLWHCARSNMQGTSAWEGSIIRFDLHPEAAGTRIEFTHAGYADSPCRDTCDQGWAFFLRSSLKRYLETGVGIPYPDIIDTRDAAPEATRATGGNE